MVFGRDAFVFPVIFQHLFVLLTGLIVYRMALAAGMPRTVALVAEGIVFFFPHMVYVANVLISHTLGMSFAVLGLYLLMRRPARAAAYPLIGVVWGAATMARFSNQYFVPAWIATALAVDVIARGRLSRQTLLRSALLLAGFLVVLAPWTYRVHKYEGGTSGYTDAWRICYSFNRAPEFRGNVRDEFQTEMLKDTTLTRADREALHKAKVLENLREHPEWFVNNWLTNLSFLLINVSTEGQTHDSIYAGIYYSILLGMWLVGLLSLSRTQHAYFLPAYVFAAVVFGVHVPVYGYISNSFPVWAAFAPIVAAGVVISFRAASRKRRGLNGAG
jgi:4-amino-4-deoxy-L-arabinose transferase-like glycosyltransferase